MDELPVTEPSSGAPDVDVLLARAGWFRVLDDLHGGLCHDLNGRVSSLDGLLHILHMDESAEEKVMGFIEGETERLSGTVKILRSLSGLPSRESEALQVDEVVARATALHQRHRGLEGQKTHATVAENTPPVRSAPPRLLRVILIVLSHLGHAARDIKASGVNAMVQGEEGRVVFRFSVHGGDGQEDLSALGDVKGPLGAVLAVDGGELDVTAAGVSFSLPALTRAGG